jgi:hypothetical protein
MGRKRRRDERDDPGLYDPEDEAAIQHGLREEPEGPEWWEGRWPAQGIASLADLECWVDDRLNEMISLDWTRPRLRDIALKGGRQALRNAARYLDRHGRGDHPPMPIPAELEHIQQVEAALGAVLRYLRQEQEHESTTKMKEVTAAGESEEQPEPELSDPDAQKERRLLHSSRSKPVVDQRTFRLFWKEHVYTMKKTKEFQVLAVLAGGFDSWVSLRDLKIRSMD